MSRPITRRRLLQTTSASAAAALLASPLLAADAPANRMNVLWILGDDLGPELSCYGYPQARTPNLDRLASRGALYRNAFTTAPVCSASRSAFITGNYQTTIGCQHHRSMTDLPAGVRPVTEIFREAGYYTAIKTKTDFNFRPEKPFDSEDWKNRKPGQPFFAQVTFMEPHRRGPGKKQRISTDPAEVAQVDAFAYARKIDDPTDPARVFVPPYYPDDPVVRREYAGYLDAVRILDGKVGELLKRIDDEGLAENTVIFFMGDNGICFPRGKQFLYEGGIRVPMIVRWPGVIKPGTVEERLISAIDMTATSLAAAGIERPKTMEGQVFAGPQAQAPRSEIIAARDRCDETVDRIRCVRSRKYKYIRNFMPERPYTQPNNYKDRSYATLAVLRLWHKAGKLNAQQAAFMADRKPEEELYDLEKDPHELTNLASSPQHQETLRAMRGKLEKWIKETDDKGQYAEKAENVRA